MAFWATLETESQRESIVRLLIMRTGRETYLPRIKHHARVTPLFPRYLFVKIVDDRWWEVRWTPHVLRILTFGEYPQADVRLEAAIAMIKKQERDGLVKLPAAVALRRGAPVRIKSGSFAGHIGIHDGMSGKDRQRVLLKMLGQTVPVELPTTDCQPLALENLRAPGP
jgi:transcription antitermination factor NusG